MKNSSFATRTRFNLSVKQIILSIFLLSNMASAISMKITDNNLRHAFFRGEKASFKLSLVNTGDKTIKSSLLTVKTEGINEQYSFDDLAAGKSITRVFELDTAMVKSGQYTLQCTAKTASGQKVQKEITYSIARKWNPERMRVWLWAHRRFGTNAWKLDESAKKQLQFYMDKGFNSIAPGGGSHGKYGTIDENKYDIFDYGMINGCEMGFDGLGFLEKEPREFDVDNPYQPQTAKWISDAVRDAMDIIEHFPGVGFCFLASEYEDNRLKIDYEGAENFIREPMPEPSEPRYIADGVIADTDKRLLDHYYHFRWGDGITFTNKMIADIIHKYRDDILVFADPLRRTHVYDRYEGLDAVSNWTYTNPDPKLTLFIETLIANAKPANQGVIHTTTLLNYPGTVASKDKGWVLMGPDRLIECSWINLSRSPQALSVYISSGLDPFDPSWKGVGVNEGADAGYPYQKYPQTLEAFKKFTNEIVAPYGPMINNMKRKPRKAAVLCSLSSWLCEPKPRLVGHYMNYQIYSFYAVLNMAHIPADVVFEETITDYGLDGYDILFLPKTPVLPESVYEKIKEFADKGGKIVADQFLKADIPGVKRVNFDFTYRDKVSANAIIENTDYAEKTDHFEQREAKLKEVKGVTAKEDQLMMEQYAKELRAALDGDFTREADCSSPTALLNTLTFDGADYIFVVNDKREYGKRLGEYKAMLEKAVSQTVEMTIKRPNFENTYIYDVIDKKELKYHRNNDKISFDVDLPAPGGKIIAVVDDKIDDLAVSMPKVIEKRGAKVKLSVIVNGKTGSPVRGLTPLEVTITDPEGKKNEFSGYFAAKSGFFSTDFIPAKNDTAGKWKVDVKELITGKSCKESFLLK